MSLPSNDSKEQQRTKTLQSIFDTAPLDFGGINARQGFAYQDDVAAMFYLQMLSDPDLIEISCETYDDILLMWQVGGIKIVEFVQVKAEHPDQLWTVAKLCERIKNSENEKGLGTSILEKSLARDQYAEPSWFRIVTCRQVDSNLSILKRDRNHEHRSLSHTPFKALSDDVGKRLSGFESKKGRAPLFWLCKACWDVITEDDIHKLNLHALNNVLFKLGFPYDPDTVRGIYSNLRVLAKDTAEYGADKWDQKRISRDKLIALIHGWVDPYPGRDKTKRLEQKFHDAGLDSICLNVAKDQQRFYLQKRLSAIYFTTEQADDVEYKVLDKLHTLRSSLDSGKINLNGVQFHDLCLNEVRELQITDCCTSPIPNYLSGCMYEITSRCRHRFTRFQP